MPTALTFDKAPSVRDFDQDGRLHVASANISAARVNPYLGNEIPDWQRLRLNPSKTYMLLRDPDELKKAAASFNNLPILKEHVPVSAHDHRPDLVVGSTGTSAAFVGPFLKNSLCIWAQDAIDKINSGSQRELSAAYRYTADMRPGVYQDQRYDGVMRSLIANHLSLVSQGRVGSDVVVGDAMPAMSTVASFHKRFPNARRIGAV